VIELKLIDGEPFIAVRNGRREATMTPQEAIAQAREGIAEAGAKLRSLAAQQDDLRARIQEAVFFDEPTADLRAELLDLTRESEASRATADRHRQDIQQINATVDRHHAEQLQRQHAAHLAELVEPYTAILKECTL
jgi:hypothetical protein